MYRTFYSLTRKPFEMSPDPYFHYPTTRHNEALALLTCGVREKKKVSSRFLGEVGTGETLLVRCLLDMPVPETEGGKEVPGALVQMIEEGGNPSRTFSRDFKKESGTKTL